MKKGPKEFSLAASSAYGLKSAEEKCELKRRYCETSKNLTAKEIKQNGCKIFKKLNMQVSHSFF